MGFPAKEGLRAEYSVSLCLWSMASVRTACWDTTLWGDCRTDTHTHTHTHTLSLILESLPFLTYIPPSFPLPSFLCLSIYYIQWNQLFTPQGLEEVAKLTMLEVLQQELVALLSLPQRHTLSLLQRTPVTLTQTLSLHVSLFLL